MMGEMINALDQFKAFRVQMEDGTSRIAPGFSRERLDLDGIDYLSVPRIKAIKESPAHFHWKYILGNREPDTDSKRFGRLLHWAMLQPQEFLKRYILMPKFSGTGMKKAKEDWLKAVPDNALIVSEDQAEKITAMIAAVYANPMAKKLLSNGTPEVQMHAEDPQYKDHLGRPVQWYGILDFYRSGNVIVELKGTKNSKKWNFSMDMDKYNYPIQNHIYQRGVHSIVKKLPDLWTIAVQNIAPFCVSVFRPARRMLDQAAYDTRIGIDLLNECRKTEYWHGYHKDPVEIDNPNYVYFREEEPEGEEDAR